MAIVMTLVMMTIVGAAAIGFDLAYIRLARLELQNATDAATHAALVKLRTSANVSEARTMAMTIASKNTVYNKALVLGADDVVFGGWNFVTKSFTSGAIPANAVQVIGARSATRGTNGAIATTFGRALGRTGVDMLHSGTAAFRIRSIVVAQDITGSFSASIDAAAAADVAMLDALHDYNLPTDRIGMQLFTGDGTQFTGLTSVYTGYSTVRAQWYGDGQPASNTNKKSGITVCNKLDIDKSSPAPYNHAWVPPCSTGGDGTNPGAAIKKAADQLLAGAQSYETRVIVLITDGRPSCCTRSGTTVSCNETNSCASGLQSYGVQMANYADANGISIFTVSFGADSVQHAYNASLARGIGIAYNTPDKNALAGILRDIAGVIPISLVR